MNLLTASGTATKDLAWQGLHGLLWHGYSCNGHYQAQTDEQQQRVYVLGWLACLSLKKVELPLAVQKRCLLETNCFGLAEYLIEI